MSRWRVALALALAVGAISTAALLFRLAAPTHPLVMAALRLTLAGLMLSPWLARAWRRGTLNASQLRASVWGGALYAIHFGAWVASLTLTHIAASMTLVTVTPLMLAAWGLITGRDKPSGRVMLALGIAMTGVLLIGWRDLSGTSDALWGDALALVGAASIGVYFALVRAQGPKLDVLAFSAGAALAGAGWLWALAWLWGAPLHVAGTQAWVALALCALGPHVIGHSLLTWSLRYISPTRAGVAVLAEPVIAIALGWVVLGERVGAMALVGCAIVLGGVMLAMSARSRGVAPAPSDS